MAAHRLTIALTVLAVGAALLRAQQAPPLFRSGIELVALDVSVMHRGAPVAGLTAKDFALTDDGVAQELESVTLENLPLSVTLALDVSSSVRGPRLRHLVDAGEGLVHALHADDRASLITFSQEIRVAVPMTGDLNRIGDSLRTLNGGGATALRDAVQLALELAPRDQTRPLLLVFTDGKDTLSWLSADAVLDSVRRIGGVIHIVSVEGDAFLDRLAATSGGRTWSATSDGQLRELFTKALDEMRARYLLTFIPRGVKGAGWHELKVKLRSGGAEVTARPGYFVAQTSGPSPPP